MWIPVVQSISLIAVLTTEMPRKVRAFYSIKKNPVLFVQTTLSGKSAFFLKISFRNLKYYSPHFDTEEEGKHFSKIFESASKTD